MGRNKKYTTNFLKEIIVLYLKKNKGIIKFNKLAEFANRELEINEISYYHFSRDEVINELINKYNENLKKDIFEYVAEENTFTTINIKEFISANYNNKNRMIELLLLLQEGQKNIYEKYIKLKMDLEARNEDLLNEKRKKNKYKEKYRNSEIYIGELKKIIKEYEGTISLYQEQQMISALNSSKLYNLELKIKNVNENIQDKKMNDLEEVKKLFPQLFE